MRVACAGRGVGRDPGYEAAVSGGSRASAVAVVAAVALSGVFLVVFVPELWWVFTTYFWVAFPALGRLSGAAGGIRESSPEPERELLEALRRHGELTPGLAAAETSLSVAEADRRLGELAGEGHLEVRVRGGGIFYALWDGEPRRSLNGGGGS